MKLYKPNSAKSNKRLFSKREFPEIVIGNPLLEQVENYLFGMLIVYKNGDIELKKLDSESEIVTSKRSDVLTAVQIGIKTP